MAVLPLIPVVLHHPRVVAVGAVFHSAVLGWAVLADSSSTDAFRTALVGGVALVLAAAIPSIVGTFRKDRETGTARNARLANDRLIAELRASKLDADAETAEWKATAEAAIRGTEIRDVEIERLRSMVVELGGNPFPRKVDESEVRRDRPREE